MLKQREPKAGNCKTEVGAQHMNCWMQLCYPSVLSGFFQAVEMNKDHPNEDKASLFIQSLLWQRSQPLSFVFDRDSKAGRGVGRLYTGKMERCQVYPNWKLLTRGNWSQAN